MSSSRRPEVSASVASVVDKATTKDPRDRYGSVGEMVRDLEATLEVEAARGGGTTGEATAVLDSVPRSRRRLAGSRFSSAGVAMALLGIVLVAAALIFGRDQFEKIGEDDAPPEGAEVVRLSEDGAAEFDPSPGDGQETETAELAVDGDPTGTAWSTEHYDTEEFGGIKDGVGLIVEANGPPVAATSIEIRAASGGWDAEIYTTAGDPPESLEGWGRPVSTITDASARQTVDLDGAEAKSFLIWITKPPESQEQPGRYQMQISDVRVLA